MLLYTADRRGVAEATINFEQQFIQPPSSFREADDFFFYSCEIIQYVNENLIKSNSNYTRNECAAQV